MKCSGVILVFTSMLLATGIILILIPCIQYDNWWPLLTIFVFFFAILFPIICQSDNEEVVLISWVFVGIFIVTGYAIPAILLRGKYIPEVGLIFTYSGGTIILTSILIFVRLVYFKKDSSLAYML